MLSAIGSEFVTDLKPGTSDRLWLDYQVTARQTTVLRIEVAADGLRFKKNVANGEIKKVKLVNDAFEAMSQDG